MRISSGTYTGNGSDNRTISGAGFSPAMVFVFTTTGSQAAGSFSRGFWRSTAFTGDSSLDMVSGWGGSGAWSNMIQSFTSDGFVIGNDASGPNVNTYYAEWVAFEADSECLYVGNYTGDNTLSRTITPGSLGFAPTFVCVQTASVGSGPLWFLPYSAIDEIGGSCWAMNSTGSAAANFLTNITATGFTVGIGANFSGRVYQYFIFGTKTGTFYNNQYTGNGSDDRNIVMGDAFQPGFVWMRPRNLVTAFKTAVLRNSSTSTGDLSYSHPINTGTVSYQANMIQAFNSNGFQVGSDINTNQNGEIYHYMAFANTPSTETPLPSLPSPPLISGGGGYVPSGGVYRRYKTMRQATRDLTHVNL